MSAANGNQLVSFIRSLLEAQKLVTMVNSAVEGRLDSTDLGKYVRGKAAEGRGADYNTIISGKIGLVSGADSRDDDYLVLFGTDNRTKGFYLARHNFDFVASVDVPPERVVELARVDETVGFCKYFELANELRSHQTCADFAPGTFVVHGEKLGIATFVGTNDAAAPLFVQFAAPVMHVRAPPRDRRRLASSERADAASSDFDARLCARSLRRRMHQDRPESRGGGAFLCASGLVFNRRRRRRRRLRRRNGGAKAEKEARQGRAVNRVDLITLLWCALAVRRPAPMPRVAGAQR